MIAMRRRGAILAMVISTALLTGAAPVWGQAAEGIKVHGRWVLEVLEPDGTLVSHHEFDNALDNFAGIGGSAALAGFLGRARTPGRWVVQLDSFVPVPGVLGGAAGPCAQIAPCVITEADAGFTPHSALFTTLTLTVPTTTVANRSVPAGTVELAGHATIGNVRPITRVSTRLSICAATSDPASCGTGVTPSIDFFFFTMHTLETPVQVTVGQIVQVRVVLSFS